MLKIGDQELCNCGSNKDCKCVCSLCSGENVEPSMYHTDRKGQFYHGTNAHLSPGDMIKTGAEVGSTVHEYEGKAHADNINWAFATPHKEVASRYAEKAASRKGGEPRIYVVKPEGKIERIGTEVRSAQGFTVVGENI